MIMRILLPFIAFLTSVNAFAAPIVIAVIDTGFGFKGRGEDAHLCKYGHKDFTIEQRYHPKFGDTVDRVPMDINGHGTNIVGLIEHELYGTGIDYCIVVIKFYSDAQSGRQNVKSNIMSLRFVNSIKPVIVNISAGGPEYSAFEAAEVQIYLENGGKLVAAAGNDANDLDIFENRYFPAQYDRRIVVVGNKPDHFVQRNTRSNYGSAVTVWEFGEKRTAYGITMSGTSQATAVTTGKIVARMKNGQ